MEQANTKETNNKRIAKNTVFLYIRMALSMLVSLYTSRVVLQTLGVEDYGIYSLVGGIVVMFQFLNSSLSGATSRFLTYELGKGDIQGLKDTFSTAMIAHLLLSALVFMVAETVGLWFISTQLMIPASRMFAAHIVYQCSVLSLLVSFTQVPYNASIISHEKMDVFAYIELLSVFLRLGIVYMLVVFNFDKLIFYAVLVLAVSMTIAIIYRVYAIKHYEECHFHFIWKPDKIKPMLTFSGWSLYGKAAASFRQFGTNSIINIFCGIVYNAAGGIAMTVHGAINAFYSNVIIAFRPQIIKQYANGNLSEMFALMMNAAKYSLLLYLMISLPLFFELPYVLHIWLGSVPDKTVDFIRLLIIASVPFTISEIINIGVDATSKVKLTYLCQGTISLCTLIPTFFLLKNGWVVTIAYVCIVIQRLIILVFNFFIIKHLIEIIDIKKFIVDLIKNVVPVTIVAFIILYFMHITFSEGLIRIFIIVFCSLIIYLSFSYFVVISNQTREMIKYKLRNIFKRNGLQ